MVPCACRLCFVVLSACLTTSSLAVNLRVGVPDGVVSSGRGGISDVGVAQLRIGAGNGTMLFKMRLPVPKKKVMVASFSRSGSTTMLDLIRASTPVLKSFALFEPCHAQDVYNHHVITGPQASGGCPNLFRDITRCDFRRVQKLWGWGNAHSKHRRKFYKPVTAAADCRHAQLQITKTIYMNDLQGHIVPLLNAVPKLQVVHIIRDPRAIYASRLQQTQQGARFRMSDAITQTMCQLLARNWHVSHPRLMKVRFEQWVGQPDPIARQIYHFLGLQFGGEQNAWVQQHFNAPSCGSGGGSFGTCRENSAHVAQKWRTQLGPQDLAMFSTPICQQALSLYGYL